MRNSLPQNLAIAFKTIVEVVKNNGIIRVLSSMIMFSIFCIMIYVLVNQDSVLKGFAKYQKELENKEHIEKVEFRMKYINPRIDGLLYNLLLKTDAQRVCVIEMHNGTDNLAGLPFIYGEITYEKVSDSEIQLIADDYGRMNLSKYPISYKIYKDRVWCGTIEELKEIDPKLGMTMSYNNEKYVYFILLRGNSTELGFLSITYNDTSRLNKEKTYGEAVYSSQELSILLDYSNNAEIKK